MSKVGLQLFSVWRDAEKNFLGTIQKAAELGYEAVQFAGFYDTPATKLQNVLKENGLYAAGAHVGIEKLLDDELKRTFEYNSAIDNNLLVCPGLPNEMRQSAEDYKKTAEILNQIGETCKEAGFTFGYHNHAFEFEQFGSETGFDLLFGHTDPDLVKMELDCYWAAFADHDPLEIIQKYKNRVVSLHIKDMKIINGTKTGIEVGRGQLDFASLIKMGDKVGVEWFTVEQEEFELDPYESLSINADTLKQLMSEAGVR